MRHRQYYNFPAFDAAKAALKEMGYEVVSPADLDRLIHHFDGMLCAPDDPCLGASTYKDCVTGEERKFDMDLCIRMDVAALLGCDGIFTLDGWEQSDGARAEVAVARWAGKKVFHGFGTLTTEAEL